MTHPNDAAHPMLDKSGTADGVTHYAYIPHSSLTKRELFATMAMQGLLANPVTANNNLDSSLIAADAVVMADALIEALNKPKETT